MSSDGTRNLQEERLQEAVIRTPDSIEPATPAPRPSGPASSSGGSANADTYARTLHLPDRSAVETSSGSSIFASEIDIPRNVIQSTGNPFIIEVVPDSRFPLYAITEYVQRTYSNFDFAPYSMVSPASLVGYLLYMIHAFVFLIDTFESPTMSAYAEEIDTTHSLRKIIDAFSNAFVPDIVFEILHSLAPHRLDVRSRLEFLTSYGSVLFHYDAPRLPAPAMFLLAHNQLISQTRSNAAYKSWLAQDLISFDGTTYKVGNLIGGMYQSTSGSTTDTFTYRNWLARSLFRLADSATHRTHLRRPDILDFDYAIPKYTESTYNPYTHLLMLEPNHRVVTLDFIRSLSSFCKSALRATNSIGSLVISRSGQITKFVIKGPTAPTWHTDPIKNVDSETNTKSGNFANFCKVAKFGLPRPDNTKKVKLPFPDDVTVIRPELYLVQSEDEPSSLQPVTADEELHTEGMNLLFDPYDDEPSAHYSTVLSGKLIQNSNIDGQVLQLPDPISPLPKTNSRYLNGAVCVSHIVPEFSNSTVYLYPRYPQNGSSEPQVSILYNMRSIWIPKFMRNISSLPSLRSFTENRGADGIIPTVNFVANAHHTKPTELDKQVLLWSSYRHRRGSDRPTEDTVYFYATLELLFGTRSSMMQTYNLHQLLSLN